MSLLAITAVHNTQNQQNKSALVPIPVSMRPVLPVTVARVAPAAPGARSITIFSTSKLRSPAASTAPAAFTAPRPGRLQAYDEAVALLLQEQALLDGRIAATNTPADKIARGYLSLESHWRFNAGLRPPASLPEDSIDVLTYETMRAVRFSTVVRKKLVSLADSHYIFRDAFPGKFVDLENPKVNMEVNFQNTNWEGCYGQPVPPNWSLFSPRITINTHSKQPKTYSLLMMDLDRPSLSSESIQEWCHWLITDIPVTSNRLTIDFGSSPFLGPTSVTNKKDLKGAEFHATKPEQEPVLPGNVVFPYIPPHPANSNPRKIHRYLLTLFEQRPDQKISVDLNDLRTSALNLVAANKSKRDWEKDYHGSREEEMKFIERGGFSTYGFCHKHGLTVAGYAFFTSNWNIHTPEIFSRLGIHEPVYGEFPKDPVETVHKIANATRAAESLVAADRVVSSLAPAQMTTLNEGILPVVPRFKVPTRASIKAERMKRAAAEAKLKAETAASAKLKKAGKGKAATTAKTPVNAAKTPRLTVLGAVAVVRAKENDVAGKKIGGLTKSIFARRSRYHNV
ncbi:MFT2-Corn MFT-like protein [Entophlyctis luteolus]|nr:MFT2-Corn MFT-like protein [Entophlyctis luteolus]